ncbi:MAG: hypothetical protein JW991_02860 [Candidatus Pacebacteria bacterium]|nr:hypothetical protein [Candidatus Paceibacterota bacterium]
MNIKKYNLNDLKYFIFPLLVLGLMAVSFFLLLWPKVIQIKEARSIIKNQETKLGRLTEKLASLKGLNETELTDRSELVLRALPESKQPMLAMSVLRHISQETGIEVKKIDVRPGELATLSAKVKNQVPSLDFSVKVTGLENQIGDFMEKLSKSLPLLRAEKISLSFGPQSLELTMDIASYYSFLPVSLGKIDTLPGILSQDEKEAYKKLENFSFPSTFSEEWLPALDAGRPNPFI